MAEKEMQSADVCTNKDKIKTSFAKIFVSGTPDRPYFNILYFDPVDQDYHIGFSSYCLEYVFKWLSEEFEIEDAPAADAAPVVHGRWELTTHSFYRDIFDESCELCVYIVANCSECSGNHPNSYQVFSKTLYAPDDADDDFRFDQKAEEEKALLEFRNKKYEFAYYCPNCGAKMDGGAGDEAD